MEKEYFLLILTYSFSIHGGTQGSERLQLSYAIMSLTPHEHRPVYFAFKLDAPSWRL